MILLVTFAYGSLKGAPWVPTRSLDVDRFLKLSDLKEGEKMYDLGSGDGRLVCAVAEKGGNAVGYEVSLFPFIISKIRQIFNGRWKKSSIQYRDFWNADLSDADVIYFFLMPKIYSKLKSKLEKELKKGARVVAYVWPIEGWEPVGVDKMEGCSNLYLYKV